MNKIHVVVGGQYGSEAKGNFTYNLTHQLRQQGRQVMVIRTGGPNAGHCVTMPDGEVFKLRMVPAGMLAGHDVLGAMAEGCEIDMQVLDEEIDMLESYGLPDIRDRLMVDPQATILESRHRDEEINLVGRIGSTGKGVGAARSDRIMRRATTYGELRPNVAGKAMDHLALTGPVVIEGTQGYGLGLHAGFYPKCTSRDVRAIDVLAEAGLSPWAAMVESTEVWIIYRTHPIRVAGASGYLYEETTWEALGLQPEFTTVTQRMRRVGQWDTSLAIDALLANGGPAENVHPVLMFFDYLDVQAPFRWEDLDEEGLEALQWFEKRLGTEIHALGVSPSEVIFRDKEFQQ